MKKIRYDYGPFFKRMKEIGLTADALMKDYDLSIAEYRRLKRNDNISNNTMIRLMHMLGIYDIRDIVNVSEED